MTVDPTKTIKILVVHGVQTGSDDRINSHEAIRKIVKAGLGDNPVDFEAEMYRYENVNDEALGRFKKVLDAFSKNLLNKIPFASLLGSVVDKGADLIGDVLVELRDGSACQAIRNGLIAKIIEIYETGNRLCIVAHSLGSIYAFDAVNELIRDEKYFDPDSRQTWPVQALVTMGSPIGLSLFKRDKVEELGEGKYKFRWFNYWARTDPVVTGSFYGKPNEGYEIAEKFKRDTATLGWDIQDRIIEVGEAWLMAHVAYWRDNRIGKDLAALITS